MASETKSSEPKSSESKSAEAKCPFNHTAASRAPPTGIGGPTSCGLICCSAFVQIQSDGRGLRLCQGI